MGIRAVPAKLMVESLLFVVNFAVQRLFIFKSGNPARTAQEAEPRRFAGDLVALAIAAVFLGALETKAHGYLGETPVRTFGNPSESSAS